jgi:hypothetical protein
VTPKDQRAGTATEKLGKPKPRIGPNLPAPGPHARPELLDPEKTPGAGTLPEPDDPNPSPTG